MRSFNVRNAVVGISLKIIPEQNLFVKIAVLLLIKILSIMVLNGVRLIAIKEKNELELERQ